MKKSTLHSKTIPARLSRLNPKCAGIDVGAAELFVCIAKNSSSQEVRSFSTFTADIKLMIEWLKKNGVESVAMESTGVYWIPPYELLEEAGFEVLLANPRFFKAVPGRKSDVKDCQWMQQLHSYGLVSGSFRPTAEIVRLRAYVRQRSRLFESAGTQVQLMHKALTQMNIQLNHVISDITGMRIIQAILQGERDPKALANLSVAGCRKKIDLIAKALEGHYCQEHVFKRITRADLTTVPGIDENIAMKLLSEIGTDMSRWRSAKAFASWLGLCPGNKVSGGKVLSSKTKPSDNKAAQALRMAAASLYRSSCYLGAFFRRMRSRLGAPKAITAAAHKLAKIIYRMLTNGEDYRELGENYYEQQYRDRVLANLKKRAKDMGYTLTPVEAA